MKKHQTEHYSVLKPVYRMCFLKTPQKQTHQQNIILFLYLFAE